ncbi:phosphohistidine swiveling domain-containing protein [Mycobacterium frederiksbergense]|uniref:Phosphohistidine swiveling domain-containing protein n=1 Tax=Mycolicibacterium frederiksbergense TaxID=117567 RepID=A0ABT6KYV3_9MYCO|nr:PEP-utilizing enzyme [Mycolicibacterium frederiksbergense]MDH6195496.1 phosphohistidine swiveling domain-containing protein [Mycolicibacterium frederiksbergense]
MRVAVGDALEDGWSGLAAELTHRGHRVSTVHDVATPADVDVVVCGPNSPSALAAQSGVRRVVLLPAAAEFRSAIPGADVLVVRTAAIMGRDSGADVQRRFATPVLIGAKNGGNVTQFIHPDDAVRFITDAVENPGWTGMVGLAAPDPLGLREVAQLLGKRYAEVPWARDLPVIDTGRLAELGFNPAWSSRDCVTDFGKANRGHIYLGGKRIRLLWRYLWARPPVLSQQQRRHPASEHGGEFDTLVDPRWPVYTAVNTSEAFPGPMTPLSLELSLDGMRAMGRQAVDEMRVSGELRRAVIEEQAGSFGHRVYANLSVLFAAGAVLPGADPSGWREKLFGARSGGAVPEFTKIPWWGMAVRLPRSLTFILSGLSEARRLDREARMGQRGAGYYAGLSDDRLRGEMRCGHDQVVSAWSAAALITLTIVPILGVLEKFAGRSLISEASGGADKLVSAGLTRATRALAAQARADASIAAILRDRDAHEALNRLRSSRPAFVTRLDAVIAEWGHRGPGETELANPVFADRPERLLDVVVKFAGTEEHRTPAARSFSPWARLLGWIASWFLRSRERARDAAIRQTHEYRLIARELGNRLVAADVIDERDDVFYLVRDEVLYPRWNTRYLVSRRKAEQQRLQRERPPIEFVDRWELNQEEAAELRSGDVLSGIAASVGLATGRVRVATAESVNDLQPGEVLVAGSIDVGWTPFFSYAAAIIVDTGAMMSHAAIVAREFSIPCVVGSHCATRVLRTGHIVRVDGGSGQVTRIS